MTDAEELKGLVDDALGLLVPYSRGTAVRNPGAEEPLESLLERCRDRAARIAAARPAPIRLIHHFACTGGTLIARALASQPNTMVLSEVDPFSRWFTPPGQFAPTDLIFLSRLDRNPPDQRTVAAMFEASLRELYAALSRQGRDLVIRDHTHSHFCADDPDSRPLLGALLGNSFDLRQIISVRHPLDSYQSLRLMNSAVGQVGTMAGYAARYLMFLDSYPGVDLFHYETFVGNPDEICRDMAAALELEYNSRWQDVLPVIRLSGDSGRKGAKIGLRPRRPIDEDLMRELEAGCPGYEELCRRLGYDPDPAGSAIPRA